MKIAVLRERSEGETRVAATPETVGKFIGLGATVTMEAGAGALSRLPDADFAAAGATVAASTVEAVAGADIILCVRRPQAGQLAGAARGALVIGAMDPYGHEAELQALAGAGVSAVAMEFMPRITRAQVMDILSSQANLAGYQAVIDAAAEFGRAFPMMMTAAGTVRPAKVFVMGAGVAGLQAIATARRLGAVVTANDVRPAAKEQVESLGGKFIAVEDEEFKQAETAGGYAKEMSAAYREKQAALTASHISKQDIVITTALIPGRPAPKLISRAMVESMAPGSVIVDLAAERGGNVELTVPGQVNEHNGVRIVGYTNVAGRIPTSASQLYSRNLLAFVETLVDKKNKVLAVNWDDDLVKATVLTRDGAMVHPNFVKPAGESAPTVAPLVAAVASPVTAAGIASPSMAQVPAAPTAEVKSTARRVRKEGRAAGASATAESAAAPAARTRGRKTPRTEAPAETGALDGPAAFVPPEMREGGTAPSVEATPAIEAQAEPPTGEIRARRSRKPSSPEGEGA